ncbi:syntaxin-4 isoform X1 [Bufo gargarizans]|uniref:syntaxin-4 isoform X1 n=2 Tax=Bufo gargarizans TaxID=30331 RepID=UPI001CF0DD4F|nr:syntaxin-4 isoform X1 [Bufo gargarizans]
MRDRTKELNLGDSDSESDEHKIFIPMTNGGSDESETDKQFFQMTREIRESMAVLSTKVTELEASQVKILSQPLPEENLKKDLQSLREEIKRLAKELRSKLQLIEIKDEDEAVRRSVHLRMKKTQHSVLSQQFIETLNRCNMVQTQYRDSNVKRIKRQLQITGHNVTDEQFDEMLESGQTDVFTCNILKDTQITKQALNEIEARHEEILKLEKSILELHDMFMYMAMEVEAQGETIDSIEKNILHSTDYVEKAKKQLDQAVDNRKKSRKKKLYIAICVVILLIIIAIIIAVSVTG